MAPDDGYRAAVPTTSEAWCAALAERLGLAAPTDEEREALLAAAGIAAHGAERTAAPITTWLLGRAGLAPAEARDLVAQLNLHLTSGAGLAERGR